MKQRLFWIEKINRLWRKRSVLWVSGVRRSGKTCLCKTLPDCTYFDCELPRVRHILDSPEDFLREHQGKRVVLDEIHRLRDPSELLKIAADHFQKTFILATGSSTLGASAKFRDTLTGRKHELWLTPMISADLEDFGQTNIKHRLLHGGLPPFFLATESLEQDYQEWMDAFWAKDVLELFRLERRQSFQQFLELLLAQSSGIFEALKFSRPCAVSHTTIANYLKVLKATFVVNVIRPFSTHKPTEIVAAPKVYGFDTGFVCYFRGWHTLRNQDIALLWEHYVLNEICAHLQHRRINYWRNKQGHEVDFIFLKAGAPPIAIECKWQASEFEPKNLFAFRRQYPNGKNLVVSRDVKHSYTHTYRNLSVTFVGLPDLIREITSSAG